MSAKTEYEKSLGEPITFAEVCRMFGYDELGRHISEEEVREAIPAVKGAHGEDNEGFGGLDSLLVAPPPKGV